jgi:hypothetical protein
MTRQPMTMADDIEAAEHAAEVLATGLRELIGLIELADKDAAPGEALTDAKKVLGTWDNYCRPTCQFRTTGACQDELHCCGCPCNDGQDQATPRTPTYAGAAQV